ncbi:MAG: polysaccharide deacetylase family protein [Candidatus Sumerlaeia bacterium]|nr:polysaccharide deacetylase family protein [Candidatus Sumerlaeia bacterium]
MWDAQPQRLPVALDTALHLLAQTGNRATFFWIGWCAERHSQWVRRVAEAGHEIACHGYAHRALDRLSREEFRAALRRTRRLLQDLSGQPVIGYRAPSLSLGPATAWALDVLIEEGFRYDSSLLVTALRANTPEVRTEAGRRAQECALNQPIPLDKLRQITPWWWESPAGSLMELPISVRPWGRIHLPFGGGLFFRVAPYWAVRATIRQFNARGTPAVMYAHPWEFDPTSPLPPGPAIERFSHWFFRNIGRRKYVRLLNEFRFIPAGEMLSRMPDARPD